MAEADGERLGSRLRIKVTEMNSRTSEIFELFEGGENPRHKKLHKAICLMYDL